MEYRVKVDKQGNRFWYNKQGQLHRLDGPAVEYASGSRLWYLNDQRHRTDGPAAEWSDGDRAWCVNGQLHRTDGPAVEYASGSRDWYINGKRLSEQEFLKRTQPTADSCEGRVIEIDGKKYRLTAM